VPDHRVRWWTQRTLTRRWLCGELHDQGVAVPIGWLCDVLGLDAAALAAAVRRTQGTNGRRHERATTTVASVSEKGSGMGGSSPSVGPIASRYQRGLTNMSR